MRSVEREREFIFSYENVMPVFKYNKRGGFILFYFNCNSEVPAVRIGTGYTSIMILCSMCECLNTICERILYCASLN